MSPYLVGGSARVKYPHYGGRASRSASQGSVASVEQPAMPAPGAAARPEPPAAVLVTLPAPQLALVVPAAAPEPPVLTERAGAAESTPERLSGQPAVPPAGAAPLPAPAAGGPLAAGPSHSDEAGSSERMERFV